MNGDGMNAMALRDLGEAAGEAGASFKQRWDAKRKQRTFDATVRAAYVAALEQAKTTGVMPDDMQEHVPVDRVTEQIGVKAVALRELGKTAPEHPLVKSARVRAVVAKQTLINYNRADRPEDRDLNQFAPTEQQAEVIFDKIKD